MIIDECDQKYGNSGNIYNQIDQVLLKILDESKDINQKREKAVLKANKIEWKLTAGSAHFFWSHLELRSCLKRPFQPKVVFWFDVYFQVFHAFSSNIERIWPRECQNRNLREICVRYT